MSPPYLRLVMARMMWRGEEVEGEGRRVTGCTLTTQMTTNQQWYFNEATERNRQNKIL
jgi:hypothetical protein